MTDLTDLQKYGEILSEAVERLWAAMIELARPTSPPTPLPRPPAKPVRVSRELEMRVGIEGKSVTVSVFADGRCLDELANYVIDPSNFVSRVMPYLHSPRAVASFLRQLQWLTAWMRKRAEGRRRAAEEILRQQRKWVEMLESEIALRKLAE
jgi:hypothetical protein